MSATAVDTLKKHLMFPLSDGSRGDGPIIPDTHPIYDYYNETNWLKGDVLKINEVTILTNSVFGLFKQITAEKLKAAVTAAATGWETLGVSDDTETALKKLDNFMWHVTEKLVKAETGVDVTEAEIPQGFAVFKTTADGLEDFQKGTDAHKRVFTKFPVKADDVFSNMRLYYAYKRIDEVFGENTDDYYFLKRLVTLTKLLFVFRVSVIAADTAKADQILQWIHSDNMAYSTIDDTTNILEDANGQPVKRKEKYALDDMFRSNVRLSHAVKQNSDTLLDTKTRVSSARDNLQSLSNTDNLVKAQRRNGLILFWVVVALLVLQIMALLAAEYMQSPMMAYLIIVTTTIVVLFIEAKDGITALINI
jgi:hypothetical protein